MARKSKTTSDDKISDPLEGLDNGAESEGDQAGDVASDPTVEAPNDAATAAADGTEVDRANPRSEEGSDLSDDQGMVDADATAEADDELKGINPENAAAAADGTEIDRANPRPSTAADDKPNDDDDPVRDMSRQLGALMPDGKVEVVFQRSHVVDDGLQGTPRETSFAEGSRHVMSVASARHFTSRGIAVEA